ncbi:MAG: DUF4965 domain-containing protein [Bacteroidales bacterium]|nr:DUF4965 domain-containing protein [Bacteroidales bacterium]
MTLRLLPCLIVLSACARLGAGDASFYTNDLHPTATPLVSVDPYFSVWSFGKELNADVTRHWTGRKQPMLAALRVDGVTYRVLGSENAVPGVPEGRIQPKLIPDSSYTRRVPEVFTRAAVQTGSNLLPTRSFYNFDCGPVRLELAFVAPLLPGDFDLISRPVNYVTFSMASTDGRKHSVQLYFEVSPRIAIDFDMTGVVASEGSADGVKYVRTGSLAQPVLERNGDDIRIDWGYFYLASEGNKGKLAVVKGQPSRERFLADGRMGESLGTVESSDFVSDDISLACCVDIGSVKRKVSQTLLLAYDDIYSIKYLGEPLRPYWNRSGQNSITSQIALAGRQHRDVMRRCEEFDRALTGEALASGGRKYANLCASVFRQVMCAHKLVEGPKGEPFFISKENFSNGCAGTVDVAYPSVPMFLLYDVKLAEGLLNHIFDYSESSEWDNDWAPHDVGRYPDAYGQRYGNSMPLEECGNMLLLTAAVVQESGDCSYAARHWSTLTRWADYAREHGQYPEDQLCTDDFAGRLANNANLSAKAILAVAAYAKMAGQIGEKDIASAWADTARRMAGLWKEAAFDGDHYRLSFDAPLTWSLKYNLVWDSLLDLNIFDPAIMQAEIPYYLSHERRYGVPLDCRETYTKTDWVMWTASMAPDAVTFDRFIDPIYDFYEDSVLLGPLSDWIETDTPRSHQMRARSVLGGFFMKMYSDRIKSRRNE